MDGNDLGMIARVFMFLLKGLKYVLILGVGKGQGTSSSTEEKRIIKPEEFAYLKDVVCVFPNGYKRLQKANYYEDKTFTDRM